MNIGSGRSHSALSGLTAEDHPQYRQIFGDASDGDVTINADTTLTRDMYYNSLTINPTFTLKTGGFRIFVRGTLTNNGTIDRSGNNGGNGGNGAGVLAARPARPAGRWRPAPSAEHRPAALGLVG